MKNISTFLLLAIVLAAASLPARSSHSSSHSRSTRCASCTRDSKGHIKRSHTAKEQFQKAHPCPSTGGGSGACPGYVIDHLRPLKRGGADEPANMQWQTYSEAKAKDRVED